MGGGDELATQNELILHLHASYREMLNVGVGILHVTALKLRDR